MRSLPTCSPATLCHLEGARVIVLHHGFASKVFFSGPRSMIDGTILPSFVLCLAKPAGPFKNKHQNRCHPRAQHSSLFCFLESPSVLVDRRSCSGATPQPVGPAVLGVPHTLGIAMAIAIAIVPPFYGIRVHTARPALLWFVGGNS